MTKMMSNFGIVVTVLALGLACQGRSQPEGVVGTLPLDHAVLLRGQQTEPVKVIPDAFGAAVNGVGLYNLGEIPAQLRWNCDDIPEGDYYLDIPAISPAYLGFNETLPSRMFLYHNEVRLEWKGCTFPVRLGAGSVSGYAARLVARDSIHLKRGDLLRVEGGNTVVGAIRLHHTRPVVDVDLPAATVLMPEPAWTRWLDLDWEPTRREGDRITQSCSLFNPGSKPLTVRLIAEVRDYLQTPLLDQAETLVIPPCGTISKTYTFLAGSGGRTRFSLAASADGCFPSLNRAKFFVDDVTTGPRPRMSLNGSWEMCYVPGAEPGETPPPDATWIPCVVPKLQSNKPGHCMWFRKAVVSPPFMAGERLVMRFGMVLSESWLTLNGKRVHHQFTGAEPFEADVTGVWKPGGTNIVLLAVRDWISYSPANRERLVQGRELIEKDGMIAPSGYGAFGAWGGCLGMGEPVYVEARPAVSVDDVSLATTLSNRMMRLDYRLVNTTTTRADVVVEPVILDAGREFFRLEQRTVSVESGASAGLTFTVPWPEGVTLWQPGAPRLYVLRTDLNGASGAADRHLQRFGFRDIRIEGIHFVVNGERMKIRSSWASAAAGVGHGRDLSDLNRRLEAIWEQQVNSVRNRDIQLSRTHNATGVGDVLEMADESGLMIKVENGSICQQAFTFDAEYWKNALASEVRMVELYRNHPSAWMWSAGNENMWGWLFQGEKIRAEGNRRQLELAKAMRAADPQRRPIEWEADGDLLGQWEYHQLHYPRELARSPDVPVSAWWGPLDGKPVVPYSMGPITLGEKPITEGEAFWPIMMAFPYGGTILFGDKAFEGAAAQGLAWEEGAQYLVNGFRDAEFALIDTYTPMSLIRPQAVVLKEETAEFYGGRTLVRGLNIHNDVPRKANFTLQWALIARNGSTLDQGVETLAMSPAELKRLEISVRLPKVRQDVAAVWTIRLLDERKREVHALSRQWRVYAPPALHVPPGLRLRVYDPLGATAAALASNGIPFSAMTGLQAPSSGEALILGRDALSRPVEGPWREQLTAFVREGGKLVVMGQSGSPDFLPFPAILAPKQGSTIAFRRAEDHPVMKGCTDDRLRWWADDHYISRGNYRKPLAGNVLPLVDVGTIDGLLETPLLEEYLGQGSILLCQMPLMEKAATAPCAGQMLQNLLDYLASPEVFRLPGKTALLAGANDKLRMALMQSRLEFEELRESFSRLDSTRFKLVIVDVESALDQQAVVALKAFAGQGGRVLLHRARPEKKALLESLLGVGLVFHDVAREASGDVQYRVLRRGNRGLLAGLSNHELCWASRNALTALRKEGYWSSVLQVPPQEFVAEYFCGVLPGGSSGARELTRPCALLEVPLGKGDVVLSQFRLDEPVGDVADTAGRLRSLLLTNLGGTLKGKEIGSLTRSARLEKYTFSPVSLAACANRGLRDDSARGLVGWTNQGDVDMRNLPVGDQVFAGVPFAISAPKSVVALYSISGNNRDLPKAVKIAVNRKADALFFMHALAWGGEARPFLYRVHYTDGSSKDIPITDGCQVFDWFADANRYSEGMAANGTVVGYSGDNPVRKGVNVLQYEWVNPEPEKEISEVDFARAGDNYGGVPVLVGVTAASLKADSGIVTEVVGLRGVKVRLGARIVDVDYIGVDPLDVNDPFHARAVEAHRTMVVGRKVLIQDDAVPVNPAGRRVAYVFLDDGSDCALRNLVNARIVGEGLSKIGNFEGNTRHRMYFENLAFIASQGKKGLWGREGK